MWLEARLKKYPHTALIISHDRELLNNSVDAILHLRDGKLDLYTGGYDDFERRRAGEVAPASRDARQAGCRARASAVASSTASSAKASKAAQAQSRIKRLAKARRRSPRWWRSASRRSRLPSPARRWRRRCCSCDGAAVGYDGTPVLRNLNLRLDVDDRIGLLGVNGAGKSTFAKMVAGALPLLAGQHAKRQPHPASAGFTSIRSRRSIPPIRRS